MMEESNFKKHIKVLLEASEQQLEENKEEFYKKYPKNKFTARNLGIRNELSSVPKSVSGT